MHVAAGGDGRGRGAPAGCRADAKTDAEDMSLQRASTRSPLDFDLDVDHLLRLARLSPDSRPRAVAIALEV